MKDTRKKRSNHKSINKWRYNIWFNSWFHFTFLFKIERWNSGDEWRLFILFWEINITKE